MTINNLFFYVKFESHFLPSEKIAFIPRETFFTFHQRFLFYQQTGCLFTKLQIFLYNPFNNHCNYLTN